MTFTTTRLVNNRVLVRGTDINGVNGECVLHTYQWDELAERVSFNKAMAEFDEATRAFYAPITEAAEKFEAQQGGKGPDPLTYIELEPAVDAVPGTRGQRVELIHDSQVLRVLASGNTDRLVWVNDFLEISEPDVSMAEAVANVEQLLGGVEVDEPQQGDNLPADASLA